MRRTFLASLAVLALAAFASSGPAAAATGDGLEGTVWKYRPKGFIQWFFFWNRDYLVFQTGNFMQASLKDEGYSPSLYHPLKTGEGIKWTAVMKSSSGTDMDWSGLRVSYWMTGTFKRDDRTVRWKAWQIFPKASKASDAGSAQTKKSEP